MLPIVYTYQLDHAKQCVASINKTGHLGLDTEVASKFAGGDPTDPYQGRTRLIQICDGVTIYVFDMFHLPMFQELHDLLTGPQLKIAHNAKFELKQLWVQYGKKLTNLFCSMIGFQVVDAGLYVQYNLEDVCNRELGLQLDKTLQGQDWGKAQLVWADVEYAAYDAMACYYLYDRIMQKAHALDLISVLKEEMKLMPVVAEMELIGVIYDANNIKKLEAKLESDTTRMLAEVQSMLPKIPLPAKCYGKSGKLTPKWAKLYPTGYKSPETRDEFMQAFGILGVEIPEARSRNQKTKQWESKRSLSKATYGKIKHPAGKKLQEYNSTGTLLNSFIRPVLPKQMEDGRWDFGWFSPVTRRIHVSLNQAGTATLRFSCSDPNLQNQPRTKDFRRSLVPPDGWVLIKADYSQIELRGAAELAARRFGPQGCKMVRAFIDDLDVHSYTASIIFNQPYASYVAENYPDGKLPKDRDHERNNIAKHVNFGTLFDQTPTGLVDFMFKKGGQIITVEQASVFIKGFYKAWPELELSKDYLVKDMIAKCSNSSYYLTRTVCGRVRHYNNVRVQTKTSRFGNLYTSVKCNEQLNHPVQGTIAGIIKDAMLRFSDMIGVQSDVHQLWLQVHDELVVVARADKAEEVAANLRKAMMDAGEQVLTHVPCKVDVTIGKNWAGDAVECMAV